MLFLICCPASCSNLRKIITYFGPILYNIESIEHMISTYKCGNHSRGLKLSYSPVDISNVLMEVSTLTVVS